jgi:hypothetical protein
MAMVVLGRYEGQPIADLQQMRHGAVGHLGTVISLARIPHNTHHPGVMYPRFPVPPVARIYAPTVY